MLKEFDEKATLHFYKHQESNNIFNQLFQPLRRWKVRACQFNEIQFFSKESKRMNCGKEMLEDISTPSSHSQSVINFFTSLCNPFGTPRRRAKFIILKPLGFSITHQILDNKMRQGSLPIKIQVQKTKCSCQLLPVLYRNNKSKQHLSEGVGYIYSFTGSALFFKHELAIVVILITFFLVLERQFLKINLF